MHRQRGEEQVQVILGVDIANVLKNSQLVALRGRRALGDVVHFCSFCFA